MDKKTLFIIAMSQGDEVINLSKALWEKYCPECEVIVLPVESYNDAIINYIADENAPEKVAFVPALTVPVSPIDFCDLEVLKSFILNDQRKKEFAKVSSIVKKVAQVRHYIPQELPNVYSKMELAKMISEFKLADKDVNIATAYAAVVKPDIVPFDASVTNSFITGLVARANPDMIIVSSYIVYRKFIVTTVDGFTAIASELEKLLQE